MVEEGAGVLDGVVMEGEEVKEFETEEVSEGVSVWDGGISFAPGTPQGFA